MKTREHKKRSYNYRDPMPKCITDRGIRNHIGARRLLRRIINRLLENYSDHLSAAKIISLHADLDPYGTNSRYTLRASNSFPAVKS